MKKYNLKNKTDIKMHNVLFATTTERDYEMERLLLLEKMPNTNYDEFVLAEGYHCSCYDFDETNWDCIKLTKDELNKNYNSLIDKIILKIDEYDYKFQKAKKQNKNDIADYYWDLIINFKKLLGGE